MNTYIVVLGDMSAAYMVNADTSLIALHQIGSEQDVPENTSVFLISDEAMGRYFMRRDLVVIAADLK